MKLATTTGDFVAYIENQKEAVSYIKQSGFRCADYSFGFDYQRNSGVFGKNPEKYIEEIKRYADNAEVEFVQAHAPMGSPIIENENYLPFIESTNRCIEACGKLGIKNIVVHSGYERGISKEECFIRNKKFYNQLFKTAEKYQVNILTENFNKMFDPEIYWADKASDLRELIDLIDHPLFHCCWDVGHANLQEMPQDEEIKILGKDIHALHIQDNFGNDDHHIAPYFGSLNLDSVMHGLIDIGYQGYFTFEADAMLHPLYRKRQYEKDRRLLLAPIEIKLKAESLLYDIGKHILSSYDCFEY